MFEKITKQDNRTNLEKEIDSVIEEMKQYKRDSTEYSAITANLEKLYKAKACDRDRRITPDTFIVVAGNLFGIALILWHEKADIITSKALGFVLKGRV